MRLNSSCLGHVSKGSTVQLYTLFSNFFSLSKFVFSYIVFPGFLIIIRTCFLISIIFLWQHPIILLIVVLIFFHFFLKFCFLDSMFSFMDYIKKLFLMSRTSFIFVFDHMLQHLLLIINWILIVNHYSVKKIIITIFGLNLR